MNFRHTLIALASLACVSVAQASIVTFTGDSTGAPTYNRALEDLSDLSLVGTSVAYDTYSFSVDISGDYTFLTTGEFDTFIFLYSPSFDAANALGNAVVGNDDLLGLTTSGFAAPLTAGTAYVFVTTGFDTPDFGKYSTTIGGPGVITAAVPEPETLALMALGLGALGWARRYKASRPA